MNRYFEIPEIKITDDLKNLPYSNYNGSDGSYGKGGHTLKMFSYSAGHIPAISNIYNNFKKQDILGQATLLTVDPGATVLPHIDAFRQAAINIPISSNWRECYTGFYSARGWRKMIFLPNILHTAGKVTRNPGGAYPLAKLEEKLVYSNAVCLNIQEMHGVVNNSNEPRYVLSISIKPQYDFKYVQDLYNAGELI